MIDLPMGLARARITPKERAEGCFRIALGKIIQSSPPTLLWAF